MLEGDLSRPGEAHQTAQLRVVRTERSASAQWNVLADAGDEAPFCAAWLALQCAHIAGTTAGLLMLRHPQKGTPFSAATWPAETLDGARELSTLAERAFLERRTIVAGEHVGSAPNGPSASPSEQIVAVPLGAGGSILAAVAIKLVTPRTSARERAEWVADELRWGAGWLEALPWARRLAGASADMAQSLACLDLLAAVGEQPPLLAMTIAITNDLAARLRCDRVSIGLRTRGGRIRLSAMSHSATFQRRARLVDALENTMEETADQGACVALPPLPATERAITIAHRALAEIVKVPGTALLSAPLADGRGESIGAITLERHGRASFDGETAQLVEAMAALLGPMVGLHMRANRLIAGRIVDSMSNGIAAVLGPRRPVLKLATGAAIALVLGLALAKGEHRVTAKSVLEAEIQTAAVAPFDGFIRAAPVRAGDAVRGGDLLAALDERDLLLDRSKWRAERGKLVQRQRDALAKHDRTSIVVLEAQIQQADSQLALAEAKLARARIVAPFDGLVVAGDLSQMLGSPVEKGKMLFEVAPRDAYRLIVHVDERDVRYIAAGQKGVVALVGMPWTPVSMELTKITPVTIAEEGRNAFRVEARLTELGSRLRPGMEGIAKIETGRRSLLWIWAHPVIEWVRLAAWKYLP
jgi:multidrug resistance efflux pump